ncbi:MAG: hypothetical protein EX272_10525 [Chromatiales bacterium]|nr:MAG: hypothetical protein EX272_10525 [Chromatiales bacterium]
MKRPLLPILLLLAAPAFAVDEALTQCRQIEEIEERVKCYDKFVDSQSASDAVPDAESLFGRDDAEAKRIVETTLAIEQIDHVEAVVTGVRKSATRKLLVTLDNGQVWRQLDNQTLRLKNGEWVIVRKASLNSFLLEKKSGSRSIRVKRAN